ncbi:MAG: LysM peptidoglycan-binding domain-containing protein [Deltaproteobacteria bacterium]|nr:MAG: LysM peptidoglycan-binding domain-containing protein [Deltaproteobacteria bacterium]
MPRSYIVKKGDTLGKIAKKELGDANLFTLIANYNGIHDPERIFVGQRLEIPTKRDTQPQPPPIIMVPGFNLIPPSGLDNIVRTFGDIVEYIRDDGTLDQRWEDEQLLRTPLPFAIPLSWDPKKQVANLYTHKKLKDLFPAVFREIERRGLKSQIRTFGGCFNFRSKRGGNKLSAHSWAVAIDLNPETNRMGTSGDMSSDVVDVFKSFGFTWGGDWSGNFKDPMHFQFCNGY